ncbi:heterokaryon incompatibility protein-domain-containing protein [Paraphoma chrysanthemicola]|uniref:Heterokaryon incompatibility protein-domain-containing protein n=1 Tax=Paraphoma chrysanthemicola TaxID=798071 RepID=A0A8K0QY54_9PLEO|nr:heterokaryon incompatibility protein-domain-containing protein [Paraphoma chrysanthemicola]
MAPKSHRFSSFANCKFNRFSSFANIHPMHPHPNMTFKHKPIEPKTQMRMLILDPAPSLDSQEPLRGRLQVIPLGTRDRYAALSYVWGDQSEQHELHLEGQVFMVGKNLHEALLHIRVGGPTDICYTWIDAICIDQNNIPERNAQVAEMVTIYRTASWVVVWLGPGDEDTNAAMDYIKHRYDRNNNRPYPWAGLSNVFLRPWWSRIWVVQEVIAGDGVSVLCGEKKYCVPWHDLIVTMTQAPEKELWERAKVPYPDIDKHIMIQWMYWDTHDDEDEITLDTLLLATTAREATDPRDQIYGLLGTINDRNYHRIEVDYFNSKERVYQDAMVSLIKSRGDLDWMGYAVGHNWPNTPSWCIDFSQKDWAERISNKHRFSPKSLSERRQGSLSTTMIHDPGQGTIKLQGERVGSIKHVLSPRLDGIKKQLDEWHNTTETLPEETIFGYRDEMAQRLLEEISRFVEFAYSALSKRLGYARAEEEISRGALWAIAATDVTKTEDFPLPGNIEKARRLFSNIQKYAETQDFWSFNTCQWANTCSAMPLKEDLEMRKILFTMARELEGSTFFATETGYIGVAQYPIKQNDALVLFYSGRFPAVLEDCGDGSFKLASFTWTHDAMRHQYLDERRLNLSKTEFVLC